MHVEPKLRRRNGAVGMPEPVEPVEGGVDRRHVQLRIAARPVHDLACADRGRAPEDHEVDERIRAEPVCSVDARAACLAHGHDARRDAIRIVRCRVQHLAPVVRGHAAHVVVHGRQDRDRFARQVDAREDARRFRDARKPFRKRLRRQVVQVKVDVVLFRADTAPLADLQGHAPAHDVPAGKILVGGRVALHEPVALGIGEIAPLAAGAFGDEAARAVDPGRVELHEFHVLQRQPGPRRHAAAVAGAGMGRRCRKVGAAIAACRQHRHLRVEDVERSVLQAPGKNALAGAVLGHDQVDREILDVEFRVVLQRLAVERVQYRVPGPVGGSAGALDGRAFPELGRVAAERPLVDPAGFGPRERNAVMLKLVDGGRRLAGEVLHRVGVAEPVGPFHRVVHVPLPVVRPHVAERGRDAALRRHRVRAGREHLRDAGRPQPLFGHAQRRAEARSPGSHDNAVELVRLVVICGHRSSL